MVSILDQTRGGQRAVLLIVAAPAEARAVASAFGVPSPEREWTVLPLGTGWEMVRSGVGKVNAALCAARCVDPKEHVAVISLGVCGALPAAERSVGSPLEIRGVVVADRAVYADEGIVTPEGFTDMAAAGFPPGGSDSRVFEGCSVPTDAVLREELVRRLSAGGVPCTTGAVATVSTCSGTDGLAREIVRRTAAIAETMEGAAIGHALARIHGTAIPFAEVRVVSNTTGDREKQVWDLKGALARLTEVVQAIRA